MSQWTRLLWRALAALGEASLAFHYPYLTAGEEAAWARQSHGDLSDAASVRAAFRSIVEREWGADALSNEKGDDTTGRRLASGHAGGADPLANHEIG